MKMNTTQRLQYLLATALASSSMLIACGDDGQSPDDADAGKTDDAGTAFVCDPKGANSEVGDLLNAPLESDIEIIVKEAQHPGDPGPTDLP